MVIARSATARIVLRQRLVRVCRHWTTLLIAIGAAILLAATPARAYDVAKFCQAGADDVVIMVDVTSAFDTRAKELFQRGISAIVTSLTPGEHLRIVTIEDSFASSKFLYQGCVPFCPSGILDILFSDCTEGLLRVENNRQQKEIAASLRGRLEEAVVDLETSDILRTLFYSTEHRSEGAHLDLYVFSDLIENSEFMAGKVFWSRSTKESLAAIKSNGFLPDLNNASTRVFGVGRGGSLERHPLAQDRIVKLHDFWKAYFDEAGAPEAEISEELYLE